MEKKALARAAFSTLFDASSKTDVICQKGYCLRSHYKTCKFLVEK